MGKVLRALLLAVAVLTGQAQAGYVILQNGDQIAGKLLRITDKELVWQSTQFGELKLNKASILAIETEGRFKLQGKKKACSWRSFDVPVVVFQCQESRPTRVSLLTLKHVVPYEDHKNASRVYGGDLRATGWKQTGNREMEYWEVNANVRLRHDDLRHKVAFHLDKQRSENIVNNQRIIDPQERGQAEYSLDWFFLPSWYWSNRLSLKTDSTRSIDTEYALSSGIGYQFWESKKSALSNELGLQYSKTRYDDTGQNTPIADERYTSFRFTTNYRYKLPFKMTLFHKHELIRSLDAREPGQALRWEFDSETGVNFPIGFGVSATFGLDWDFVNHAKDQNLQASKSDAIYRAGVNYDW